MTTPTDKNALEVPFAMSAAESQRLAKKQLEFSRIVTIVFKTSLNEEAYDMTKRIIPNYKCCEATCKLYIDTIPQESLGKLNDDLDNNSAIYMEFSLPNKMIVKGKFRLIEKTIINNTHEEDALIVKYISSGIVEMERTCE